MEKYLDDYDETLSEFFEFTAELMDVGFDENFFGYGGEHIRAVVIFIDAMPGDFLATKFLSSYEFWIDCDTKKLDFFKKDFRDLISGTNLDLNTLKAPVQKYIDYKEGLIDACPFTDEDIENMWEFLHALIKHSFYYLLERRKKDQNYISSYPIEEVRRRFKL